MNHQNLALYIHVPFCEARCAYCDFYSTTGLDEASAEAYIAAVKTQLKHYNQRQAQLCFDSIYIGGGSPSFLPIKQLKQLLELVAPYVRPGSSEVTIELNPADINREKLAVLKDSCLSRLSFGIQSLDTTVRDLIGRRGSVKAIVTSMESVLANWSGGVSVDCMYGLPGQTPASLDATLHTILDWAIQHISLYELIVEEQSPLAKRLRNRELSLPVEDAIDESWMAAQQTLKGSGFIRYEVSNWALPGQTCRHNQHYWRLCDWLAIGPSAVGNRMLPDGSYVRYTNTTDLAAYLDYPAYQGTSQRVCGADALFEYLMMALRTKEGLSLTEMNERYSWADRRLIDTSLRSYPDYFVWAGDRISPTDRGLDMLNLPLQALLSNLPKCPLDSML